MENKTSDFESFMEIRTFMSQVLEANERGASRDQERDNSFGDRMPLESHREKMGQKEIFMREKQSNLLYVYTEFSVTGLLSSGW